VRTTPSPLLALQQARRHLLEHGHCPTGLVDERLARSWGRSMAAGLAPTGRAMADLPSPGDLRQAMAGNHSLLTPLAPHHGIPVRPGAPQPQRGGAGRPCGHAHAHPGQPRLHRQGRARGADLRRLVARGPPGHQRHRHRAGRRHAVEVHGGEHFLERNSFLTCAASPILSATGELLGILDISGDHRNGHAHTLGLVSTAARMIENRLLVATCKRNVRLHLHREPEGIGSVAEGIVAVSADGWIVGANRVALTQLGLHMGDVGATPLAQVLDVRLDDLLSHHHRRPQQPQALRLRGGALLYAQVQLDAAAWPAPCASPLPTSSAAAPDDALARLDTGDARWRAAADKARRVVGKPIPVLIQGESGVGKEVFARALHASGPRRAGPFVAINCAAIPEHLIESELFGHVAGAFTGARKEGSLGRLREAHGGTLFLDEIGDMPLPLQTRLLRVLQDRSVTPVGAGHAVPVDFCLISATHCQLLQAAEQGRFRHDLYYRLNGLTVQLPALRERTDFAALTAQLLADLATEQGLPHPVQVAPDLLQRLAAHPWPGNLRQYASVLRTACAMLAEDEDTLGWEHLGDDIVQALQTAAPGPCPQGCPRNVPSPEPGPVPAWQPPVLSLQELSSAAIDQALQSARGNVSQAARQLGISRQTLYRKLAARVH
jgi:transcriptional regulator of acetoin/glycerol metabolism